MTASALTAFASQIVGYVAAPALQTVTVTNTGNQAITPTQPTSTNYTIGTLSTTNLAVGGTVTFTVQPKTGLAVGAYNETINVTSTGSASTSVSAQFTVTAAASTSSGSGSSTSDDASVIGGGATLPAGRFAGDHDERGRPNRHNGDSRYGQV